MKVDFCKVGNRSAGVQARSVAFGGSGTYAESNKEGLVAKTGGVVSMRAARDMSRDASVPRC